MVCYSNAPMECDGWIMHVRKTNRDTANGQYFLVHSMTVMYSYSSLT
jgi:hypothetical protein